MRIMIYSFSLFHLSVCLNWSSGNISFHRFQCNRHANHLHKSHDTPTWVSTRHNHGNILACRFCCFRIVDHFCKNPYHPTTCLSQSPRRSHLPMSLLQSWLGNKLGLKIIFYDFQISSHFFIFYENNDLESLEIRLNLYLRGPELTHWSSCCCLLSLQIQERSDFLWLEWRSSWQPLRVALLSYWDWVIYYQASGLVISNLN